MMQHPNVVPFKAYTRDRHLRRLALVFGVLATAGLALTGYERVQQSGLPTVTAFSPNLPPYGSRVSAVAQRGPGGYRVIDGDTIEAPFGVKYRLLGFDTPETYFSKCDEELALGRKATRRLEELLASGEVRIVETGKTGKYGRALAHLYIDGRDVGEILIGEGLARAYDGERRGSWC